MKENFQKAYNTMMKLANNAQNNVDNLEVFPKGNEMANVWKEKAECYKYCATALMTACTNSGIILDTESNLHPVFDNILNNIKAAS